MHATVPRNRPIESADELHARLVGDALAEFRGFPSFREHRGKPPFALLPREHPLRNPLNANIYTAPPSGFVSAEAARSLLPGTSEEYPASLSKVQIGCRRYIERIHKLLARKVERGQSPTLTQAEAQPASQYEIACLAQGLGRRIIYWPYVDYLQWVFVNRPGMVARSGRGAGRHVGPLSHPLSRPTVEEERAAVVHLAQQIEQMGEGIGA